MRSKSQIKEKKAPLFKAGMKWELKNHFSESPVLQNGVWGFTKETMSWTCPYELNGRCKRLRKSCQPGVKGCILKDKVKFLDLSKEDLSVGEVNLKNKTRD